MPVIERSPKRIDFVTLFPSLILGVLETSIPARAFKQGVTQYRAINPRDYCYDLHRKVDDAPFGGHPGMLLRAEPVAVAIDNLLVKDIKTAVVFTEPAGIPFTQKAAEELGDYDQVIFVCGHYEGIDHRVEESYATHVYSIGDYVLTNGELPALVMADAMIRRLPGVLGSAQSLEEDSFSAGILSAPNYTRPETWREMTVPAVLTSGHHANIEKWRVAESLRITKERRPDLLKD